MNLKQLGSNLSKTPDTVYEGEDPRRFRHKRPTAVINEGEQLDLIRVVRIHVLRCEVKVRLPVSSTVVSSTEHSCCILFVLLFSTVV